jgi:hypothetical protein
MKDEATGRELEGIRRTRFALLLSNLLHEPLASLYLWLPFILRKDLHATPFQLGLLAMLKPVVSVCSFYWDRFIAERGLSLRFNLIVCGLLGRLPFFGCLLTDNIWFVITAAALHMLFLRAAIPPWMEMLKLNLPKARRESLFSLGTALGFAEGVLLAVSLGFLLDANPSLWKWCFVSSGLLGILATLIQARLPVQETARPPAPQEGSFWLKPWKDTVALMRTRPDFALFQWGFMACGFGLMLVIPVIPLFAVDILNLTHADFATARSICAGLCISLFSPLWGKAMGRLSIHQVTTLVCLCFALFLATLLLSPASTSLFYLAFALYGVAQAGSHIAWHLSGPTFAGTEDSSRFSSVNIMMVGLRGLIAPGIGSLLYSQFGPLTPLTCGLILCLAGSLVARRRIVTS